ncbi:MAG: acetyl-CoA carboxylase biotin carboxyl carrier protein subunit [Chlorobiaceae bacterium]|nr:acetyl-CoA carboxylase biotin carboxyl carrier protein subunit [Chlorobiaceae bacterium]
MQLTLTIDGKKYIVDVEVLEGEEVRSPAEYAEQTSTIKSHHATPPVVPVAQAPGPASDGLPDEKVCRSPIAGIVQRVNVQVGQKLQVDDLLVVLEAMKMETNITAHTAGIVKCILASPGEAVKSGQALIEFE